jgi:hypothetical protein
MKIHVILDVRTRRLLFSSHSFNFLLDELIRIMRYNHDCKGWILAEREEP